MPKGGGIGSKAAYGEGERDGAVEERESVRMGAEGEWDKGEGGGGCKKSLYVGYVENR